MAVEDQSGATGSNAFVAVGNCSSKADAQSKAAIELKEICSFGNDIAPKVRKPYTITKQREKWTEEEHQKFLEALKLFGRGWRQIEEHVGTKTAVQIRSHAQKFFSKVAKESSGTSEASIKPIEIPPPRPKRKPMHPYPRKSVDSRNVSPERSPSPHSSVAEKGHQSPTSVLSAVGSDVLGSAALDQHNRSPSSNSCTTDMRSTSLSHAEKENDYMTSNSSAEEMKVSMSSVQLSADLEKSSSTNNGSDSKHTVSTEGDTANVGASTSIKLFGRTVLVTDLQKQSPSGTEDCKLATPKTKQENDEPVRTLRLDQSDTHLSLGGIVSNWNSLTCGATINRVEHPKESPNAVEVNLDSPLPWWIMYQGGPFFHLMPYNQSSVQTPVNSCVDERMKDKERSCCGWNGGSVNTVENLGEKHLEGVDSLCKEQLRTVEPCNSRKGFLPYKRCLADRNMNSSAMISEEMRDRQRARVCS